MTHDHLCPALNCIEIDCADCCQCDLIAKARNEENPRESKDPVYMKLAKARANSWKYGRMRGVEDSIDAAIGVIATHCIRAGKMDPHSPDLEFSANLLKELSTLRVRLLHELEER